MEKLYGNEIKKVLPILQAVAEGKTIQELRDDWRDIDMEEDGLYIESLVNYIDDYRIKPEPKYRPFKDAEECWQEMQKHQPFGWVKNKGGEERYNIVSIDTKYIYFSPTMSSTNYNIVFDEYVFADGEPFGVKEEGV